MDMKEPEYQNCFAIVSAALFGAGGEYRVSPELFEIAGKHSILPLVCGQLMKKCKMDTETKRFCREQVISSVINNERRLQAQAEVSLLFSKEHISYAIMKGCSVSMLYPDPDLRPLGDVDILVAEEDKSLADKILTDAGYHFWSEQEYHRCYDRDGTDVEIHTAMSFFAETPQGRNAAQASAEAIHHIKPASIAETDFYILTPGYQLLSLLTHMERHMKGSGIGLRQLCDWAVTIDHYRSEIGEKEIFLLERCGLLCYAAVLTGACEKYLGMPPFDWGVSIDDQTVDMMMEEICAGGSVSYFSTERGLSQYFISENEEVSQLPVWQRYYKNVVLKIQREHPCLAKIPAISAVFCVFYPIQWMIRRIAGKRKRVSIFQILKMARKRKKLYEKLFGTKAP